MTTRLIPHVLAAREEIVAPPAPRACNDQTFELPRGIYVAMIAMFTGFFAVMALAFRGGHMEVAFGAIFAFVGIFFAIPVLFPRLAKGSGSAKALSWYEFGRFGIKTATGHATAAEATTLILLLPFLILCFAFAIAIIASVA